MGVVLDDGRELEARRVLSSAGWVETLRICGEEQRAAPEDFGQLSFVESISVLDRAPKRIGHSDTIVFYNDSPKYEWRRPEGLCDVRTGVVCSPNNLPGIAGR